MPLIPKLASKIARSEGDPKIISTGPSSFDGVDRMGRMLGWLSFALGATEIAAAKQICETLGMEGKENLIRAYGVREIGAGVLCLSIETWAGLWARLGGDAVDIATLMPALGNHNPKRKNVAIALAVVLGVTALDAAAAVADASRHKRNGAAAKDYGSRSGFPNGMKVVRGAAKDVAAAGMKYGTPGFGGGSAALHRSGTSEGAA